MRLIEEENLKPSQAAERVGIQPSTVFRSKLYKEFLRKKEEEEQKRLAKPRQPPQP